MISLTSKNVVKIDVLRDKYGIKETGFFEAFKQSYDDLEKRIVKLVENTQIERLRSIAHTIQYYEKPFWDSIYSLNKAKS